MVKTRLGEWIRRRRERRLARQQTRQTPEARRAAGAAEAQRYKPTGHGPWKAPPSSSASGLSTAVVGVIAVLCLTLAWLLPRSAP